MSTHQKIAVKVEQSCTSRTAKSAHGVACISLRRLGHPARALSWVTEIFLVFPLFPSAPIPSGRHFFRAADVASTSPKYELGKVTFSSMFLKRKKSQRFGAHLFPSVITHAKKIPLPSLGRSYTIQKNPFETGRNSERCSYHTDLSRFVLPVSDPSALNVSQFVGFQNFPEWIQNEKVAETFEFDGKED